MLTINGLEGLQSLYAVFEFRNRTTEQQTINLANGDRAQVQPGAIGRVQSELFTQLPAFNVFEPIQPSVQEIIDAGLIKSAGEAKPIPDPVGEEQVGDKQTGGQPLAKGNKS